MKVLALVFHPNMASSTVNRRLMAELNKNSGKNLIVRNEYGVYPDEKIVVAKEQKLLEWADRIILQFPFYWYSCPPLLKKWEDLVLEHGWAYGTNGVALHAKELLIAVSCGAAKEKYRPDGEFGITVSELLAPFKATSNLIGTKFLPPFITFGSLTLSSKNLETQVKKYISAVTK